MLGCSFIKLGSPLIFLSSSLVMAASLVLTPSIIDTASNKYGPEAKERAIALEALIDNNKGKPDLVKLKLVNKFFNKIEYLPDQDAWGERNYWATPLEFLGNNAGDCEDFAIAKYFVLKSLGVPTQKMRLTYVKSLRLNQAHMVLTYYEKPNGEPLILDSLRKFILYATERPDLQPVYSFNGDGVWKTDSLISRGSAKRVGGSNKMRLWLELEKRMADEGF